MHITNIEMKKERKTKCVAIRERRRNLYEILRKDVKTIAEICKRGMNQRDPRKSKRQPVTDKWHSQAKKAATIGRTGVPTPRMILFKVRVFKLIYP